MALSETSPSGSRGRNGKTATLVTQLRGEILSGARVPGDQLPSFAEMRRLHGVAPLTTDKIYGELEREGLLERRNGRGIFVKENTRPRTGVIGFCGAGTVERSGQRSSYYGPLVEGVQGQAARAGYEVLLLNLGSRISWERMDGLLVSQGFAKDLLNAMPPGMLFVTMIIGWEQHPRVVPQDEEAMREMTEHLLHLGHRRIAIVSAGDTGYSVPRLQGYRDAMLQAGITPRPEWRRYVKPVPGEHGFFEYGRHMMREWLAQDWADLSCTAIMAYNDDAACGVIAALREAGLRVPQDVSVTGFDGILTPGEPLRLTTARVPLLEIGSRAFENLHGWIEHEIRPENVALPSVFTVGDTTGTPAG